MCLTPFSVFIRRSIINEIGDVFQNMSNILCCSLFKSVRFICFPCIWNEINGSHNMAAVMQCYFQLGFKNTDLKSLAAFTAFQILSEGWGEKEVGMNTWKTCFLKNKTWLENNQPFILEIKNVSPSLYFPYLPLQLPTEPENSQVKSSAFISLAITLKNWFLIFYAEAATLIAGPQSHEGSWAKTTSCKTSKCLTFRFVR